MIVEIDLSVEQQSTSASAKYKFDGKSVLVSPLVKTMFEAYLKARTESNKAFNALKTKKERYAKMAAQIKSAKTPDGKQSLKTRRAKLKAEIQEDNKKLAHLKSEVSAARKVAGLTYTVLNKPGKPTARVGKLGKLVAFKFVSQEKFDAAKAVKVK